VRVLTISQIGAFTALSNADADYLALRPSKCSGIGEAPVRITEEPAPGEDGALIEPPLDDAWIITLAGELVVTSTGLSSETGYRPAIDTLLASLRAAINAAKAAPIELVHSGGTLSVWKYSAVDETWDDLETICEVTFSLLVDVFA
jgi:hypothetical protein